MSEHNSTRAAPDPIHVLHSYDASSITVLPGLEAVRKNPSMYIGSIGQEGLHHLVYEVVDNSIDESQAGFCSRIAITVGADGSCAIEDNGRGIPVGIHPEHGKPACEVVLTTLHSGGKFKKGSYQVSAGMHGVGISCVNALSEWLELEVWIDGIHYRQHYARGVPLSGVQVIGPTEKRGTLLRFLPDASIFQQARAFSYATLSKRLEELAYLHPGILITIEDQRTGRTQGFQYQSGIFGYVEHINRSRTVLHPRPIHILDSMDGVEIELAMQWTTAYADDVISFVNSINTIYGGTHVNGLKAALNRVINDYADQAGMIAAENGEKIAIFDILEGLTCVMSILMPNPQFEGQTKTRLSNRDLKKLVELVVGRHLAAAFKDDPRLAVQIVGRALEATRARQAARRAAETARFHSIDTRVTEEVYQKQFGIRSRNWHESATWITDKGLLGLHADLCKKAGNTRMLDVCCGSGVVGAAFKGRVGEMVGLDLTPQMIELAKERLDEVHQGTVYDLPYKDESFGLVVNREVLHLLPHPEKPVSEIYRVLEPGGQFIVGQIIPYGAMDAAWMFRIFKKKQPLFFNNFQEEDFRRLLQGAGFVNIQMKEYLLWESIDLWIDTHETTNLHRHEIRDLFYNAPAEARAVHPFEILPSGEIRDQWRWAVFSCFKPGEGFFQ